MLKAREDETIEGWSVGSTQGMGRRDGALVDGGESARFLFLSPFDLVCASGYPPFTRALVPRKEVLSLESSG